ncbi:MAG: fatty acid cis/trans isomerase, partial [Bdellovibrionales bacterium]
KNLFWNAKWSKKESEMPFNFNETNPLIAFRFIPAKSRYTWMLENSKLLLDISARAQNCRTIGAGAPYWDNMLHIFLKPESDVTVINEDFAENAGHVLRIPRTHNGRHSILDEFLSDQMEYSKIKQVMLKKHRPNGFLMSDIWDGDSGDNKNAIVTVLRHEWTAAAYQGQMGATPRSVLLLDYALFERYFYLCNVATEITEPTIKQGAVVNYLFDVKKEGEDQFLSFMDEKLRRSIRQNLVQGFDVDKEFGPTFSLTQNPANEKIDFDNNNVYGSFIKNFLIKRFSPQIIGSKSLIIENKDAKFSSISQEIRKNLNPNAQQLFASHLPNVSYLLVLDQGKIEYFSLLANRYYSSRNQLGLLNNIKYDKSTRVPTRDLIEVYDGIESNFPEKFFIVKAENLVSFLQDMKAIRTREDYLSFSSKHGLDQNHKFFWNYMDSINAFFIRENPLEGGIIDLHKYGSVD